MKTSDLLNKLPLCSIAFLVCFLSLRSYAQQAGTLDSAFGNNGVVICETNFPQNPVLSGMDDQNRIVAWGKSSNSTWTLFRYLQDGSVDASFGNNGQLTLFTNSATPGLLQFQHDDKIILAGNIEHWPDTVPNNYTDIFITRFFPDGSLDSLFGNQGSVIIDLGQNEYSTSLNMYRDSLILVAGASGWSSWGGSYYEAALIRLQPDGKLDSSFATNGIAIADSTPTGLRLGGSTALLVMPDDKIIIATHAGCFSLLRYDAVGNLDASFGNNGIMADTFTSFFGYDIAIDDDLSIIVAGAESCMDCMSNLEVHKYTPDGIIDSSFAALGSYQSWSKYDHRGFFSLVIQSDHKIVTTGAWEDSLLLMRFTAQGFPDSTFGVKGWTLNQFDGLSCEGTIVSLVANDKILVVGREIPEFYNHKVFIARFNNDINNSVPYETNTGQYIAMVYPNPATDFLTITLPRNSNKADVIVTDLTGKVVYKTSASQKEKMEIDTHDFVAGVYLVQIRTRKFTETKRVVIQN